MATYVVLTESGSEAGSTEAVSFKFRHRSRDGHPTAQAEFDRRRRAGEHVVMTRWENFEERVVARWDDPR